MGKIKYKIKPNLPEIDVLEYDGHLSEEVEAFIGKELIEEEVRTGDYWIKAANGKKSLLKGVYLSKNMIDNSIHVFEPEEFHKFHETVESEEELKVCQASPDYQTMCFELEQEMDILKQHLANMGSNEMQKNIRFQCVDLATRTSQTEGSGSKMPHDATSLIQAAELIYTFINK